MRRDLAACSYAISADSMTPSSASDLIVGGLPANGEHPMHPFVIDAGGSMFMDVGSATNSCQIKSRKLESPGRKPCTEPRTRGGEQAARCRGASSGWSDDWR